MLEKEEVPPRVAFFFYQVVVASVLLFGSETWVLPPSAYKALEGFHVEAARHLTGMVPREEKGEWVYPHSADVLAAAHLQPIEHYIQKRRHTIAQTIGGRKILEECRGAERRRGTQPRLYWWDQNFDLPEMRIYSDGKGGGAQEEGREVARARWRLPAPLQVPRGPMPEEATEEDRRRWAAAHMADYVIDPEEEAEIHAANRSLMRREAAKEAAAEARRNRDCLLPQRRPAPPAPAPAPALPPAPGPPTSWARMVMDAEDRRLGTETVVRARARQRAAAAAAANEEARSC
jgi:hypothetical protein